MIAGDASSRSVSPEIQIESGGAHPTGPVIPSVTN